MNPKKVILPLLLLIVVAGAFFYYNQSSTAVENTTIATKVKKGDFLVRVSATGELKAKRSEKIVGPQSMRAAGIWQTSITDLVEEGTVVGAGEYVATLDRTELETKMKDGFAEMEKLDTQLEQAKIDTAIDMRGVRDQLINLKFSMKEKELQVEQSKYEPQMVIQQAVIDLQRTGRDYDQLLSTYKLKQDQAMAKISEINAQIKQQTNKIDLLKNLNEAFIIKAPKDGMVIYDRNWNGEKKGPGSQINSWNPTVAELPDLSDMISKTYVNEVDISRVKVGQDVTINVDAFPDNEYTGQVIQVANIGEQLRGFDSKVFEVSVQINEQDTILRPAMTTGIEILTDTYKDVLSIPLESLHSDTLAFVYKQTPNAIIKQEVLTGLSNDNAIIIEHGLEASDKVLLSIPENDDDLKMSYIDKAIKDEIKRKQLEEKAKRQAQMLEKQNQVDKEQIPSSGGGGM